MGYSLEYKEWTGENVEAEFSIAEASGNIGPDMEKEFIPYEQALALKELGFNEVCLGKYYKALEYTFDDLRSGDSIKFNEGNPTILSIGTYVRGKHSTVVCSAPTFSQAFRWFREKYKIQAKPISVVQGKDIWYNMSIIIPLNDFFDIINEYKRFNTYEEAELECLKKLIEIVKSK
jgi:hypothetical protein